MSYPSREVAEELLREAEAVNPGQWGDHCRVAAACAEKIADKVGLDANKAYVLGLLHDIGRKFLVRDMGHLYYGYKYMNSLRFTDVAKVCLTHSFHTKDFNAYLGKVDISEAEAEEVKEFLKTVVYDDYDRLIQLCDALASAQGVVDIEERMADVKRRYGSYPQSQWDKNLELKKYFEDRLGENIYEFLARLTFVV